MENLPMISVIVPVYNTEKYLKKCFDSLIKQTYPNIEYVIVDDASTDDSKTIIHEYMNKNLKFKLVKHDENRGLFQARLSGFAASSGEYIAFLDSDDSVSMDYYRKLLRTIEEKKADICFADWAFDNAKKERTLFVNEEIRCTDIEFDKTQMLDKFFSNHNYDFSWQLVWNKLIKREVVEKSFADLSEFSKKAGHLIMCEDIAYSTTFYLNANKVVNCHDVYYFYFKGLKNSTTIKTIEKFEKMLGDVVKVLGYVKHILEKYNLYAKYKNDYEKLYLFYQRVYYKIAIELKCKKVYKNYMQIPEENGANLFVEIEKVQGLDRRYDEYEKVISAICSKNTKVVSFDIFDTLLVRKTYSPKDVFVFLGQEFANELTNAPFVRFSEIRALAEYLSRNEANKYETTLDEIYNYMVEHFFVSKDLADRIKKREIELEYKFLSKRETGFSLYDIAKLSGKKVVFTSDMYLPKNTISSFLEKNGYDIGDKLYLSCERKKSKFNGQLFGELIKEEGVKPSQVVHVGDNYHADVEIANSLGVNAFYLQRTLDAFYQNIYNDFIYSDLSGKDLRNMDYLGIRSLTAIVANKLYDFPFVEKSSVFQRNAKVVGYYAVGAYLYAFTRWVIDESSGCGCLHFVARDGYLPLKAYEIIKEKTSLALPKSDYFFMSRKFLFALAIKEPKDFLSSMNLINVGAHSISKIIKYFPDNCINKEFYESIAESDREEKFVSYEGFLAKIDIIAKCIDYAKLEKYHQKVKEYFDKILLNGDIIVDIGYNGRAESILNENFGKKLNSLYIHANADTLLFNKKRFGFNNKCFYDYKPKVTGVLRELVFMKQEASFVGYAFDKDGVKKVFDEGYVRKENEAAIIDIVQSNALQFVKDVCDAFYDCFDYIDVPKMIPSQPWEAYLHGSSDFDREIFESFVFEDDIGFGQINLIQDWKIQNYSIYPVSSDVIAGERAEAYVKPNLFVRIGNKLLPFGSRRRDRLKRIANRLAPVGTKRRTFCKKLAGRN